MIKAHKEGTATFDALNYAEQAKSINAQLLHIEAAIKANIKRAVSEEGKALKKHGSATCKK
ncbi:MAG: hypothetical protein LBG27_14350 [Spirochaetaceae bacterium]|jgi:hypothetical protein|nr:hypothetical protein [Spirochaetaceae bacterium]